MLLRPRCGNERATEDVRCAWLWRVDGAGPDIVGIVARQDSGPDDTRPRQGSEAQEAQLPRLSMPSSHQRRRYDGADGRPSEDFQCRAGVLRAAAPGQRQLSPQFGDDDTAGAPQPRRVARRRPAGPVRTKIAANDDAPSIGGLIYALDQKPSTKPFKYAGIASAVWGVVAFVFCAAFIKTELDQGLGFLDAIARPQSFLALSALLVPVAVIWFLALSPGARTS